MKACVDSHVLEIITRSCRYVDLRLCRRDRCPETCFGLIVVTCGWSYTFKEIFMHEVGGVDGERFQAVKEAFDNMLRNRML